MLTHPPIKGDLMDDVLKTMGADSTLSILQTFSKTQYIYLGKIIAKENKNRSDLKKLRTILAHNMLYLYYAREVVGAEQFDEAMMDVQDYIQSSISKNSP